MKGSSIIILVIILSMSIGFIGGVKAENSSNVKESLKIYTLSQNVFINLTIENYDLFYRKLSDVLEMDLSSLSLNITDIYIRDWKSQYLYFIEGDYYRDLMFEVFPHNSIALKIDSIVPGAEDQFVRTFSEILNTRFLQKDGEYVGYTEFDAFGRFFSSVIQPGNYTPFLKWVDPLAIRSIGDVLILNIQVRNETAYLYIYVFKQAAIRDNVWRLSNVLSTSQPYKNKSGVSSELFLYFKNVYIYSKPDVNFSSSYDPQNDVTIFYTDNPVNLGSPADVSFGLYPYSPVVIVQRWFNSSQFSNGQYIDVMLNVTVPSWSGPIFNASITESEWWDGEKIILVSGETEKTYGVISPGVTKSIKYTIKINTSEPIDVYIQPAIVQVSFLVDKTVSYKSNSNILHLNRPSPLINLQVLSNEKEEPKASSSSTISAKISNQGDIVARDVIFSGFLIGDLDPGSSVVINRTIEYKSIDELLKTFSVDASYRFENKTYRITSSSFDISPILDIYVDFPVKVNFNYFKVNESFATYTLRMSNQVKSPIHGLDIYVRLFSGKLINSSHNLTVSGSYYILRDVSIDVDEPFTLKLNVSYGGTTITFIPEVKIFKGKRLLYQNDIDYFYNTIDSEIAGFRNQTMSGESYSFSFILSNRFEEPIYNLSITFSRGSDIEIFPNEVNRPRIDGYLNETFTFNFTSPSPGNYSLPTMRVSYWYLGKLRVDTIKLGNISVYSGLDIEVLNNRINIPVNKEFILKLRITADTLKVYRDIKLFLDVPKGIDIINYSKSDGIRVNLTSTEQTVEVTLFAKTPGTYQIKNITLSYDFLGDQFDERLIKTVYVTVKEDVYGTYLIWFIPGILISVGFALLIRKRLLYQ